MEKLRSPAEQDTPVELLTTAQVHAGHNGHATSVHVNGAAASHGDGQVQATPDKLPRNVRVLGITGFLNDTAGELSFPLLPAFVASLGGGVWWLGIIEGVAETTSSLVKLFSGALSDRAGTRKVFVLIGYLLAAFSRPIMAVAGHPWHVVVVRFGDRFGKGVRAAPRDAMVADVTRPEFRGRAYGFARAMDNLGAAVGGLLGFFFLLVLPDEMRLLFILAAVPGALAVLMLIFGLREKPGEVAVPVKEPWQPSLVPLDRNFRLYMVSLVIFTLGNSSDIFLLTRVRDVMENDWGKSLSLPLVPLVWSLFHIIKSGAGMIAGRVIDRVGPRPAIYAGWILYVVVYLAFAWVTSAWQAWTFFLIYGLCFALTDPAERTLVASLAGKRHKGLAFGWFNLAIGIAALPANLLFGILYQAYGPGAAFGVSAILAIVAINVLALVKPMAAIAETTDDATLGPIRMDSDFNLAPASANGHSGDNHAPRVSFTTSEDGVAEI